MTGNSEMGDKYMSQNFTNITAYKKMMNSLQPTPLVNAHEQCKNIQAEIAIEKLPRSIYISSRKDERSLVKLKNDFRRNVFEHKNFDQFLTSNEGKKYFMGVSKSNENIDMIEELQNREC